MKNVELAALIEERKRNNNPLLIALDGRCAAGKTTLAAYLSAAVDGTVFHMDDYFLQPFQRTRERLETPGGNVDHERFREEILLPVVRGSRQVRYRPFDCRTQSFREIVAEEVKPVVIVEGAYSCHPALWNAYHLHVFVDVAAPEQMRRILVRNGETQAQRFRERWIPLEELYFKTYRIRERCEICMDTVGG